MIGLCASKGEVSISAPRIAEAKERISRSIKSTQRVTLHHNIQVNGDINACADVMLRDNVIVCGDVDCKRNVFLSDGAAVRGKVTAYAVQFTTTAMGAAATLSSNIQRKVIVGGNVESKSSYSRKWQSEKC